MGMFEKKGLFEEKESLEKGLKKKKNSAWP